MRTAFARLVLLGTLVLPRAWAEETPAPPPPPLDPAYAQVTVDKASTSIYIGKVTPEFARHGATYSTTYAAKVFPFFFQNEKGSLEINLTDDQLAQLAAGQRVYFTGDATNTDGEPRKVEGHADPTDALSGHIKVRVFVTETIQLIFNTTYRFSGA